MIIQCLCEHQFSIKKRAEFDIDQEPGVIEQIKNGTFNSFTCPKCTSLVRPDMPIVLKWASKNQILSFIPEKNRLACVSFCANGLANDGEKPMFEAGQTPVIGYMELNDRINVIGDGLNIVVIEALKYIVSSESGKSGLELYYNSNDGEKIEFTVRGLKQDEIGLIKVPFNLYKSIEADYQKDPNNPLFESLHIGAYIFHTNIDNTE